LGINACQTSPATAGRLSTTTSAGKTLSYQYDAAGNRTRITWSDVTPFYVSTSYDSDNRLKTAASTDLATPVTANLTYDAQGRLRQTQINIGGGASNKKTSQLLYDGVDLVAEYDTSTNALQRRYVHGPGVDEPLVWYEGATTTTKSWLYADHLGSIIATANAAGSSSINTYGPFGENAQTTPDNNRFGYTGQQQLKGLGLNYYKARVYSPALGRFLQTDPIGYVGNSPLNGRDPSGLAVDWFKGATLSGGSKTQSGPWRSYLPGTQAGDSAAQYWANLQVSTGNNFYAVPGVLASLWTPDTAVETLFTLGSAGGGSALSQAAGPLKQWLRVGPSYSRAGQFEVELSVRWGASPAGGGKYIQQIPSTTMQNLNQWLRAQQILFGGWRAADPGHFHLFR
jgi:RHS repeat-associated protein